MNTRALAVAYVAGILSAVGLVTIGILAGTEAERRRRKHRPGTLVGGDNGLHVVKT